MKWTKVTLPSSECEVQNKNIGLMHMSIRVLDMFCGMSAFRSAAEKIGGFEFVGYCDNDPTAIAAYRTLYNTEGEIYYDNARTVNTDEIPDFDLLVGGFPCVAFSAAGRRLAFKDERGTLFFELARILEAKRPAFFVFENVPPIRTIQKGQVFTAILSEISRLGYVCEWQCVDGSAYLPQSRKRVFIVGYLDSRCAGEILFVPQSLYRRTVSGAAPWEKAAAPPGAGADAAKRRLLVHPPVVGTLCASGAGLSRPAGMGSESDLCIVSAGFRYKAGSKAGNIGYQTEMASTLIAGQPSGVLTAAVMGDPENWELTVRRLTPLEAERAMGLEDSWTEYGHDGRKISDTKRYEMLGNSLAINCVAYIMQGICQALERRNQS